MAVMLVASNATGTGPLPSPNHGGILTISSLTAKTVVPEPVANISTSTKVAVMIETRGDKSIVPLLVHFIAVLGPGWPIVIYTTGENEGTFVTSQALARYVKSGQVHIRRLSEGTFFPSWDSVSAFLVEKWLWQSLAPAEHVLVFQADSILCAASTASVEDFFEYDLVGAPIDSVWGAGYNGGLSLRKRSTLMRVLDKYSWVENPKPRPEDQWFYSRVKDLMKEEEEAGITDGIKLPSMEVARTFAVETIDYPYPLGLHQPTRFLRHHMVELDDWCPEWKLAQIPRM